MAWTCLRISNLWTQSRISKKVINLSQLKAQWVNDDGNKNTNKNSLTKFPSTTIFTYLLFWCNIYVFLTETEALYHPFIKKKKFIYFSPSFLLFIPVAKGNRGVNERGKVRGIKENKKIQVLLFWINVFNQTQIYHHDKNTRKLLSAKASGFLCFLKSIPTALCVPGYSKG